MRHLILIPMLLTLAACGVDFSTDTDAGEYEHADLCVDNRFAEASFSIDMALSDVTIGNPVIAGQRVPAYTTSVARNAIEGRDGQDLFFLVKTTSAGKYDEFHLKTQFQAGRMLCVVYDLDTVTMEFRAVLQWRDAQAQ